MSDWVDTSQATPGQNWGSYPSTPFTPFTPFEQSGTPFAPLGIPLDDKGLNLDVGNVSPQFEPIISPFMSGTNFYTVPPNKEPDEEKKYKKEDVDLITAEISSAASKSGQEVLKLGAVVVAGLSPKLVLYMIEKFKTYDPDDFATICNGENKLLCSLKPFIQKSSNEYLLTLGELTVRLKEFTNDENLFSNLVLPKGKTGYFNRNNPNQLSMYEIHDIIDDNSPLPTTMPVRMDYISDLMKFLVKELEFLEIVVNRSTCGVKNLWTLVKWMYYEGLEEGFRDYVDNFSASPELLGVKGWVFYNLLAVLKGVFNQNGMFIVVPFIEGFLDDVQVGFKSTIDTALDGDPIVTLLKNHPNQYLIRLSPSKNMTFECMSLKEGKFELYTFTIKNDASLYNLEHTYRMTPQLERNVAVSWVEQYNQSLIGSEGYNAAPLQHSVLVEPYPWTTNPVSHAPTEPGLTNSYLATSTNSETMKYASIHALVSVIGALVRFVKQTSAANEDFSEVKFLFPGMLYILYRFEMDVSISNKDPAAAPLFAKYAVQDYLEKDCNIGVTVRKNFPNYMEYFQTMFGKWPEFVRDKAFRSPFDAEKYLGLQNWKTICNGVHPTITPSGDQACGVNLNWMISQPPPQTPNTFMAGIIQGIYKNFIEGSLWNCPNKSEANLSNAWHLLRWFGVRNAVSLSKDLLNNDVYRTRADAVDPQLSNVWRFVANAMKSSSFFLFISEFDAMNMLESIGTQGSAVVALSTKNSMELIIYRREQEKLTVPYNIWKYWLKDKDDPPWDGDRANINRWIYSVFFYFRVNLYRRAKLALLSNVEFFNSYRLQCGVDKRDLILFQPGQNHVKTQLDKINANFTYPNKYKSSWKEIESFTIANGGENEGVSFVVCSTYSAQQIDYVGKSGKNNCIDTTDTENLNWMVMKQPILADREALYKNGANNINLKTLIYVWPVLDRILSKCWCTSGYEGNRSRTILVNWLGIDALKYVEKNRNKLPKVVPPYTKQKNARSWFLLKFIEEFMSFPGFYPFLNPYEQEQLTLMYPGKLVVTLDLTYPGRLNVFGMEENSQMIGRSDLHTTIDVFEVLAGFMPDDAQGISLSLAMYLIIYQINKKHLLFLEGNLKRQVCKDGSPSQIREETNTLCKTSIEKLFPIYIEDIKFNLDLPVGKEFKMLTVLADMNFDEKTNKFTLFGPRLNRAINIESEKGVAGNVRTAILSSLEELQTMAGAFSLLQRYGQERWIDWWKRQPSISDVSQSVWQTYFTNWFFAETDKSATEKINAASTTDVVKGLLAVFQEEVLQSLADTSVPITSITKEQLEKLDKKSKDFEKQSFASGIYDRLKFKIAGSGRTHQSRIPEIKNENNNAAQNAVQLSEKPDFEERGSSGSSDKYEGFVIENGTVKPKLSQENWITKDRTPTTLKGLGDDALVIEALKNIAKDWCPTLQHQIWLWRWVGIGCLGRKTYEILSDNALRIQQKNDDFVSGDTETDSKTDKLRLNSQAERRYMLARFGRELPDEGTIDKCASRINFLQDCMLSDFLFPFVPDANSLRELASENPGRVIVTLDPSRSGVLLMTRQSRQGFEEKTADASQIFDVLKYTPTSLRFKVFDIFEGGLLASNTKYYQKFVKKFGDRTGCKMQDMRLSSIRHVLPKEYQKSLDKLVGDYNARKSSGQEPSKANQVRRREYYNMSLVLQGKNLTTSELTKFERIYHLEHKLPKSPEEDKKILGKAKEMFSVAFADTKEQEAKNLETISLCLRPEFVPYLREKYRRMNPSRSKEEIARLTREQLCQRLTNSPSVSLNVKLNLWDLRGVPSNLKDSVTGMLDLQSPSIENDVDAWLMKFYGVRRQTMIIQTQKSPMDSNYMVERAKEISREEDKEASIEKSRIFKVVERHQILSSGSACTSHNNNEETCENSYCSYVEGYCNQLPAVKLMHKVVSSFCDPTVPLMSSDFEFIIKAYHSLINYADISQGKTYTPLKLPEKMCRESIQIMNKLVSESADRSWYTLTIKQLLSGNKGAKSLSKEYSFFEEDGKPPPASRRKSVKEAWKYFKSLPYNKDKTLMFTLLSLFHEAAVNGILQFE
jgi:hypothetical protein